LFVAEFAHRIAELEHARREAVAGQHTAQPSKFKIYYLQG
jgi:hypothetical protein